jgi:hypothetical protein
VTAGALVDVLIDGGTPATLFGHAV